MEEARTPEKDWRTFRKTVYAVCCAGRGLKWTLQDCSPLRRDLPDAGGTSRADIARIRREHGAVKTESYKQRTDAGHDAVRAGGANIVRILKTAGFEFVIIDCEHGYFDLSQTAALIGMGSCCGLPVFVRVPSTGREYITKVMDMGAAGLLVPMVNSAEDARQAVEYAKYTPLGKRGISTQRAHTNYAPPPLEEYLKMANQRTMIMVQLETRELLAILGKLQKRKG